MSKTILRSIDTLSDNGLSSLSRRRARDLQRTQGVPTSEVVNEPADHTLGNDVTVGPRGSET